MPPEIKLHEVKLLLNSAGMGLMFMTCAPKPDKPCRYVLGDLHGNAFKLFAFLVWTGVIKFVDATTKIGIFSDIVTAYYDKNYEDFYKTVSLLQLDPDVAKLVKLIFLGDTLCDRGMSDYMTFMLFEWMHAKGIDFTIILSNHDLGFIHKFNNPDKGFMLDPHDSFDINEQNKTHVDSIYNNIYLPHLKLIDYCNIPGKTLVFTHAPCNMEAITSYLTKTKRSISANISDNINTINQNLITELKLFCSPESPTSHPLAEFVENRNLHKILSGNYINVFGHVGELKVIYSYYQINLDTNVGRPDWNQEGIMLVLQVF